MAATKELTIAGKIGLPADELEAATTIHNTRAAITESEALLSKALGIDFKFEVGVVVTRGPRKPATGTSGGEKTHG